MDPFKDLIWDNLIEAALIELFVAFPFLNFWPVNAIIRYIVMEVSSRVYIGIVLFIDVTAIPIKNEELKREFGKSAVKLQLVARGAGIDSEEFQNARVENKDHLRKFIRVGPRAA